MPGKCHFIQWVILLFPFQAVSRLVIELLFFKKQSDSQAGLYQGYKARNARLDALAAAPPAYLATSSVPLANQTFADVSSPKTLDEIHEHLFTKHALLDRVIRARKLHHSRFFFLKLDYGHQNYLDNLQNQKFLVLRALERLERRTAEVLYKQKKWFNWVCQCQDEEAARRDKESKRIKREAALFKRHWKELELRMKDLRTKEDVRRQEEYLDNEYRNRLSQAAEEEADWDPVEDVAENERGIFVELIKHFLWRSDLSEEKRESAEPDDIGGSADSDTSYRPEVTNDKTKVKPSSTANGFPRVEQIAEAKDLDEETSSAPSKGRKSSKNKKKSRDISSTQEPAEKITEAREEMRKRLQQGSEYKHEYGPVALLVKGTIENPTLLTKTFSLPDDEIDRLLEEVSEIKHLLFCRLLLSYAALLPAALRASSVEDFLNDDEVSEPHLRDLCLKMEQPRLEDIRNACADLLRSGQQSEEDSGSEDDDEEAEDGDKANQSLFPRRARSGALPKSWSSKRERKLREQRKAGKSLVKEPLGGQEVIDFGVIDDGGPPTKKIRVKICGRLISKDPSKKAMTRGGWFHFCIIAKDSNLYDAIQLCRDWDEFFELNILAIFHYFPAANWVSWVGDKLRQQYLQLVILPNALVMYLGYLF